MATTRVLLVSLDPSSSLQVISCGGQKEDWSRAQSILMYLREDCTFSNPPFLLLPLSSLYSLLNDIFERGLGPSLLLPPSPSFSPLLEGDFITQIYGKFVTMQDTQLATIHPPWGGDC